MRRKESEASGRRVAMVRTGDEGGEELVGVQRRTDAVEDECGREGPERAQRLDGADARDAKERRDRDWDGQAESDAHADLAEQHPRVGAPALWVAAGEACEQEDGGERESVVEAALDVEHVADLGGNVVTTDQR